MHSLCARCMVLQWKLEVNNGWDSSCMMYLLPVSSGMSLYFIPACKYRVTELSERKLVIHTLVPAIIIIAILSPHDQLQKRLFCQVLLSLLLALLTPLCCILLKFPCSQVIFLTLKLAIHLYIQLL